mmetsp:Transcript_105258/g.181521  ORF Transcript_105258/g.181521 Transcript_105258/m.181521 type:complete len:439 (-) Transcript_105258:415-1731(-)
MENNLESVRPPPPSICSTTARALLLKIVGCQPQPAAKRCLHCYGTKMYLLAKPLLGTQFVGWVLFLLLLLGLLLSRCQCHGLAVVLLHCRHPQLLLSCCRLYVHLRGRRVHDRRGRPHGGAPWGHPDGHPLLSHPLGGDGWFRLMHHAVIRKPITIAREEDQGGALLGLDTDVQVVERRTATLLHIIQIHEHGGEALELVLAGGDHREPVAVFHELLGLLVLGHLERFKADVARRRHSAPGVPLGPREQLLDPVLQGIGGRRYRGAHLKDRIVQQHRGAGAAGTELVALLEELPIPDRAVSEQLRGILHQRIAISIRQEPFDGEDWGIRTADNQPRSVKVHIKEGLREPALQFLSAVFHSLVVDSSGHTPGCPSLQDALFQARKSLLIVRHFNPKPLQQLGVDRNVGCHRPRIILALCASASGQSPHAHYGHTHQHHW